MILHLMSPSENFKSFLHRAFWATGLAVLMLVSGCATSTTERTSVVLKEGAVQGFYPFRYGVTPPILGMLRSEQASPHVLWVVIEGDGRAWLNQREPSSDPTPVDAVGWRLAKEAGSDAVLYLSRPCQFLSVAELKSCTIDDWTNARFSEKWVARMNMAIDEAKRSVHAKRVALAGYSGGGVMAALIAARRNDVSRLVTVAAPLDHAAWTTLHKVTPLTTSLSVLPVREKLFGLPQVHVVGAEDKVVPPYLLQDFLLAYPTNASTALIVLPGIDHRMRTVIDLARVGTAELSK